MPLILEQRMEPVLLTIEEYELAQIKRTLKEHIFNEGQTEKLINKYQDYLYHAEQHLKKGTITKDEYLTVACFYLFPVRQLTLPFADEKKTFLHTLKKHYGMRPQVLVTLEGEQDEDAISLSVPRTELEGAHLLFTVKDRVQHIIEGLAMQALSDLEYALNKNPDHLKEHYANAFGLVKVTPAYFDFTSDKHEERYAGIAQGLRFNITVPRGLE